MQQKSFIVVLAIATLLSVSCTQDDLRRLSPKNNIVASIQSPSTRTAVDNTEEGSDVTGIVWTEGDQIGVFDATGTAQKCYEKVGADRQPKAEFSATDAFDDPKFAYYPYSAGNEGRSMTSLLGSLPSEQRADEGLLSGDYKIGRAKGQSENGYEFEFTHLFSLCRISLDATGTPLADDNLKSVTVQVTRGETEVPICGDFTFNLRNLSWSMGSNLGNSISLKWTKYPAMKDVVNPHYISLFPNVKEGDTFTIEVLTENYLATFSATCRVDFQRENIYNLPLSLKNYKSLRVYDKDGNEVDINGGETPEPEPDPEPVVTTGTFTACAFNVDGLPQKVGLIPINKDGPGSSGTTTMARIANNLGWDIIAASEDFQYHEELATGLSNYDAGTYRGTVTSSNTSSSRRADTDGLCFFWKTGLTVTSEGNSPGSDKWEKMVQYTDEEGGLTGGANTCIKKGFRHYEVMVDATNNVIVDVYITHMNTYSGDGNTESNAYVKAVLGQLRQLRDYVLDKAKENKRPAIIMGDTNMRYTRHDIKSNLLDYVASYDNNAGYTISDPWAELVRGSYPTHGTKSLMIRAHANKDGISSDIICSDDQRGEVVDKIWYINVPGAEVQLKATSHKNDIDNFTTGQQSVTFSNATLEDENGNITEKQTITYDKVTGYSDHFPVVTTFEWTKTVVAGQ